MTLEEMFPDANYHMIDIDLDDIYAFANFYVPPGYWYCTEDDLTAKFAEKELSIYMLGGYLKMVDPKDPTSGTCYRWV